MMYNLKAEINFNGIKFEKDENSWLYTADTKLIVPERKLVYPDGNEAELYLGKAS